MRPLKPLKAKSNYLLWLSLAAWLPGCQQSTSAPQWASLQMDITQSFPSVEQLSLTDYSADYQHSILIDVREPAEYAVSHLPGAINLQDVDTIAELVGTADQPIVVYCSVGYRSAAVAEQLVALDIENVFNLEGSLFAWANQGGRLVNQSGDTDVVHPFNDYWGQLLDRDIKTQY